MISVKEALECINNMHWKQLKTVTLPIEAAYGHVLSEDITSPIDMPPFRQSSMDGYAVNGISADKPFTLLGEVKAGDTPTYELTEGECVRIFTGAAVPKTATAVIMQENVDRNENYISIKQPDLHSKFIREQGEQIKKSAIALQKGHLLNAASIGFLASLGISVVNVFAHPKIAIVITGDELMAHGDELEPGKVYESNALSLKMALKGMGFEDVETYRVKDNYENTCHTIQRALEASDLLLISGGISVGDYDFVGKALRELKISTIFYKVSQKPGKPLLVGRKEEKMILALPGNPASALTCFYVYGYPLLQQFMGKTDWHLPRVLAKSASTIKGELPRAQFLKARLERDSVEVLGGQASSMMQSFALANALIYIPAFADNIESGTVVEVLALPK